MPAINENSTLQGLSKAERYQFNMLARHQTIERLQKDILFDIRVCQIEGWNPREYIRMIRDMLEQLPK